MTSAAKTAGKTAVDDKPVLSAVPSRKERRAKPHVLDRNRAYGLEYYPNPNAMRINTNRQLCKTEYSHFEDLKKAPQILQGLAKIPGIKEVSLYHYEITIHKHELFVWETLEKQILKIFLKHYQKGKQPAKRVYNHRHELTMSSPRPNSWW